MAEINDLLAASGERDKPTRDSVMASAEQDIASGEGDTPTRDSVMASAEQDIVSGEGD